MTTKPTTREDEPQPTEATKAVPEEDAEATQDPRADAGPEPIEEPLEGTGETERSDRPGAEAARYRRQLRTTEAQRDALRTELDQLRTGVAEGAVADLVAKPAALWLTGLKVEDYFVGGILDVEALRAAAKAATAEHGLAVPLRFQGSAGGSSSSRTSAQSAPTWSDVLRS